MRSSGSPRAESISTGSSACSPRSCLSSSRPLPSGSITSSITAAGGGSARALRALSPSWQARTLKPSCCSQLPSSSQSSRSSSIRSRSVMVVSIGAKRRSDPFAAAPVASAGAQATDDEGDQHAAAADGEPLLLLAEQARWLGGLGLLELQLEALVLLAQAADLRALALAGGGRLQLLDVPLAVGQLLLQGGDAPGAVVGGGLGRRRLQAQRPGLFGMQGGGDAERGEQQGERALAHGYSGWRFSSYGPASSLRA